MPRESAFFIRLALGHLVLGFLAGAWLLASKGYALPTPPNLLLVHVELVLFGFMVQLALAVAWWIFPRIEARRPPATGLWYPGLLWMVGLWSVVAGNLMNLWPLQVAGHLLKLLGLLGLMRHLWPRIRPYRHAG